MSVIGFSAQMVFPSCPSGQLFGLFGASVVVVVVVVVVVAASVVVVAASVVVVAASVVLGASVVTGSVGATQVGYPSGEHGPHLAHASELHMHLSDHGLACPLHQPSHFAMGCGSHSAQPAQAPELQAHLAPHGALKPWHHQSQLSDESTGLGSMQATMTTMSFASIICAE